MQSANVEELKSYYDPFCCECLPSTSSKSQEELDYRSTIRIYHFKRQTRKGVLLIQVFDRYGVIDNTSNVEEVIGHMGYMPERQLAKLICNTSRIPSGKIPLWKTQFRGPCTRRCGGKQFATSAQHFHLSFEVCYEPETTISTNFWKFESINNEALYVSAEEKKEYLKLFKEIFFLDLEGEENALKRYIKKVFDTFFSLKTFKEKEDWTHLSYIRSFNRKDFILSPRHASSTPACLIQRTLTDVGIIFECFFEINMRDRRIPHSQNYSGNFLASINPRFLLCRGCQHVKGGRTHIHFQVDIVNKFNEELTCWIEETRKIYGLKDPFEKREALKKPLPNGRMPLLPFFFGHRHFTVIMTEEERKNIEGIFDCYLRYDKTIADFKTWFNYLNSTQPILYNEKALTYLVDMDIDPEHFSHLKELSNIKDFAKKPSLEMLAEPEEICETMELRKREAELIRSLPIIDKVCFSVQQNNFVFTKPDEKKADSTSAIMALPSREYAEFSLAEMSESLYRKQKDNKENASVTLPLSNKEYATSSHVGIQANFTGNTMREECESVTVALPNKEGAKFSLAEMSESLKAKANHEDVSVTIALPNKEYLSYFFAEKIETFSKTTNTKELASISLPYARKEAALLSVATSQSQQFKKDKEIVENAVIIWPVKNSSLAEISITAPSQHDENTVQNEVVYNFSEDDDDSILNMGMEEFERTIKEATNDTWDEISQAQTVSNQEENVVADQLSSSGNQDNLLSSSTAINQPLSSQATNVNENKALSPVLPKVTIGPSTNQVPESRITKEDKAILNEFLILNSEKTPTEQMQIPADQEVEEKRTEENGLGRMEEVPSTSRDNVQVPERAEMRGMPRDRREVSTAISGISYRQLILPHLCAKEIKCRSEYILGDKAFSQGGHGYIVAAKHLRTQVRLCAKIFKLEVKKDADAETKRIRWDATLKDYNREFKMLVSTNGICHPNIMRMINCDPTRTTIYIQMVDGQNMKEWRKTCRDELRKIIHPRPGTDLEKVCKKLAFGVASAIKTLHGLEIVHRDITPSNIVVERNRKTGEIEKAVLIDFGAADFVINCNGYHAKTVPGYAAPETMPKSIGQNDKPTDIFSFGCCLFYLLYGQNPCHEVDNLERKKREERWVEIAKKRNYKLKEIENPGMEEIIDCATAVQPDDRKTIEELMQFEWLYGSIEPQTMKVTKDYGPEFTCEYAEAQIRIIKKTAENDALQPIDPSTCLACANNYTSCIRHNKFNEAEDKRVQKLYAVKSLYQIRVPDPADRPRTSVEQDEAKDKLNLKRGPSTPQAAKQVGRSSEDVYVRFTRALSSVHLQPSTSQLLDVSPSAPQPSPSFSTSSWSIPHHEPPRKRFCEDPIVPQATNLHTASLEQRSDHQFASNAKAALSSQRPPHPPSKVQDIRYRPMPQPPPNLSAPSAFILPPPPPPPIFGQALLQAPAISLPPQQSQAYRELRHPYARSAQVPSLSLPPHQLSEQQRLHLASSSVYRETLHSEQYQRSQPNQQQRHNNNYSAPSSSREPSIHSYTSNHPHHPYSQDRPAQTTSTSQRRPRSRSRSPTSSSSRKQTHHSSSLNQSRYNYQR